MKRNQSKNYHSNLSHIPDSDFSSTTPESVLREKELFGKLEEVIDSLPRRQKEIFLLRYYSELPFHEIAKICKRSDGAIKSSYFFAMQKIKNALEEDGLFDF
jgi:RNA polymerase sigma-70 factor (ECF subfamily)